MASSDPANPIPRPSQSDAERIAELEHALHLTKRQLRAATEAFAAHSEASTGSWECNVATMQVRWSLGLKEMLGISGTSATEDMQARIHPDNKQAWSIQVEAALLTGAPINIEVRFKRTGRHYIWLHVAGRVVGEGADRR